MSDSGLCENIKQNLESQGINLSEVELQELYTSVFCSMLEVLEKGDTIDISNFGSLWMKKGETSSMTVFKPAESLMERINAQK